MGWVGLSWWPQAGEFEILVSGTFCAIFRRLVVCRGLRVTLYVLQEALRFFVFLRHRLGAEYVRSTDSSSVELEPQPVVVVGLFRHRFSKPHASFLRTRHQLSCGTVRTNFVLSPAGVMHTHALFPVRNRFCLSRPIRVRAGVPWRRARAQSSHTVSDTRRNEWIAPQPPEPFDLTSKSMKKFRARLDLI